MNRERNKIARAMAGNDAKQLLEIAREHALLVKETTYHDTEGFPKKIMSDSLTLGIINERIRQLQNERDEILKKYE